MIADWTHRIAAKLPSFDQQAMDSIVSSLNQLGFTNYAFKMPEVHIPALGKDDPLLVTDPSLVEPSKPDSGQYSQSELVDDILSLPGWTMSIPTASSAGVFLASKPKPSSHPQAFYSPFLVAPATGWTNSLLSRDSQKTFPPIETSWYLPQSSGNQTQSEAPYVLTPCASDDESPCHWLPRALVDDI